MAVPRPAPQIGCAGYPVDPIEYATELSFVEVQETFDEPPPPEEAARLTAGTEVACSLVAWQVITHPRTAPSYRNLRSDIPEHAAVGHFARSRWTDEAWGRMDAVARSLKARAVVFRTPESFTRGEEHALRLENFVAHAQRPGLVLAWEWSGGWGAADALALCERLGIVPVVDPLERPIPDGEPVYLRVKGGRNGRASAPEGKLAALADRLRGRAGYVVFSNKQAWEDARRLAKML